MIFSAKSVLQGDNHKVVSCGDKPCRTLELDSEIGLSKHYRNGLPLNTNAALGRIVTAGVDFFNDLLRERKARILSEYKDRVG